MKNIMDKIIPSKKHSTADELMLIGSWIALGFIGIAALAIVVNDMLTQVLDKPTAHPEVPYAAAAMGVTVGALIGVWGLFLKQTEKRPAEETTLNHQASI